MSLRGCSRLALVLSVLGALPACKKDGDVAKVKSEGSAGDAAPAGNSDYNLPDVAQVDDAKDLSEPYRKLRDALLAINSKTDLDALLDKADKDFKDDMPADYRLVVANLSLLQAFRGAVFRARDIFGENNVSHNAALTSIKWAAEYTKAFLPTNEWSTLFAYVTEPVTEADLKPLKTPADLQNALYVPVAEGQPQPGPTLYARLETAIARVGKVAADVSAAPAGSRKPLLLDQRMFYGPASFKDDVDHYRSVGLAEIYANLGSLYSAQSAILVAASYDLEDLAKFAEAVGKAYGIDSLINKLDGLPAQLVVQTARKFPALGTLKKPAGKQMMALALTKVQQSAAFARKSWTAIKDRAGSERDLVNSRAAQAQKRVTELALADVEALVKGETDLHSAVVQSDFVKINMPAFYNDPPEDLKTLLPEHFEGEDADGMKSVTVGATQVPVRDYLRGRPTAWNGAAYAKYMSGQPVDAAGRIIAQAWGGPLLLPFVKVFIY